MGIANRQLILIPGFAKGSTIAVFDHEEEDIIFEGTAAEWIAWRRTEAAKHAEFEIREILVGLSSGGKLYGDRTLTYERALARRREVHGDNRANTEHGEAGEVRALRRLREEAEGCPPGWD